MENRQPPGPGAPEPPLRGSLTDAPLPQILHRIFLEQLKGTLTLTRSGEVRVKLGDAAALGPGTWTMTMYFVTGDTAWESPPAPFRQPF